MNTTEYPEVKAYLDAIEGISEFFELHAVDVGKLADLEYDPNGWDWADHDGARVIDELWLQASKENDQIALARICRLRALAWDAALKDYRDGSPKRIVPPSARADANGLPCVVIDRDGWGGDFVYADPGVVVFSRCAHIPRDPLYRYDPPAVPEGWLDIPAGSSNDGSRADQRAPRHTEAERDFAPANGS